MTRGGALATIAFVLLGACVPEGPATDRNGSQAAPAPAQPPRPATPASTSASLPAYPGPSKPILAAPFEDNFERAELGADWAALSPKWKITNGRLCGKGARNRGVWLSKRIPANARIEFDAIAEAAEGDLKVELWGDGETGATGASYTNATSYIAILGGWKNTKHVLARLDEHGVDRLELDVDPNSDDERARSVAAGQAYHFKVERADGKTLVWSVNGVVYFELADPDPLVGVGHDHLGFNDWDAPVCFDNVKVVPL